MTTTIERKAAELVATNVHYCASVLVHELAQNMNYYDDLFPVLSRFPEFGECGTHTGECIYCQDGEQVTVDSNYGTCDGCFDPDPEEALEHWIVSSWLADKLEAEGEMIVRGFLGLTIWGRTTTGMAISHDYVIEKIAQEYY